MARTPDRGRAHRPPPGPAGHGPQLFPALGEGRRPPPRLRPATAGLRRGRTEQGGGRRRHPAGPRVHPQTGREAMDEAPQCRRRLLRRARREAERHLTGDTAVGRRLAAARPKRDRAAWRRYAPRNSPGAVATLARRDKLTEAHGTVGARRAPATEPGAPKPANSPRTGSITTPRIRSPSGTEYRKPRFRPSSAWSPHPLRRSRFGRHSTSCGWSRPAADRPSGAVKRCLIPYDRRAAPHRALAGLLTRRYVPDTSDSGADGVVDGARAD
ncbi:hypothetical protein LV779_34685 [Streptomyces thinghirensis]|nr:hypothetical protein [Streptomyces thinghirensis]